MQKKNWKIQEIPQNRKIFTEYQKNTIKYQKSTSKYKEYHKIQKY